MNACSVVFTGVRQVQLQPQPRPAFGDGEVLVRTVRTLISPGTELALYQGTHAGLRDPEIPFAKYPHRPGYAAIGRIEACGSAIKELMPRDTVFFLGHHETWSAWSPAQALWARAPSDLTVDQILLARLTQIAATATLCFRSPPERVVVLGAGLIGLLAAQVLQAQGVPSVVVQDVNAARLAIAERCGLMRCVLGTGTSLQPALDALGAEPDAIVEATGVPALVPAALAAVRRRGDVVLLGSPRGSIEIDIYKHVHRKGVALVGAHEAMIPDRASPGQPSRQALLEQALQWLRAGKIRIDGLVTSVVRPEALPAAYEQISRDKSNTLGVIVDWT
ncbi:MAG TPA: zinc-binding dehydrogenase [Opitutaceae bacterium]|nr:zinc-binding dehydrogenase [Opitutaceae bacterium]